MMQTWLIAKMSDFVVGKQLMEYLAKHSKNRICRYALLRLALVTSGDFAIKAHLAGTKNNLERIASFARLVLCTKSCRI